MGLAERLAEGPKVQHRKCVVGKLLESLPPKDSVAVQQAIDMIRSVDPRERTAGKNPYTSRWLARVLIEEGHKMNASTVSDHVSKVCRCGS